MYVRCQKEQIDTLFVRLGGQEGGWGALAESPNLHMAGTIFCTSWTVIHFCTVSSKRHKQARNLLWNAAPLSCLQDLHIGLCRGHRTLDCPVCVSGHILYKLSRPGAGEVYKATGSSSLCVYACKYQMSRLALEHVWTWIGDSLAHMLHSLKFWCKLLCRPYYCWLV
jgi:hypothetical protein